MHLLAFECAPDEPDEHVIAPAALAVHAQQSAVAAQYLNKEVDPGIWTLA